MATIRAVEEPLGRLTVVAMTTDAQDHHRQIYLAAGLDGYVTKPMQLNARRDKLARVLVATVSNKRARPETGA